MMRIKVNPQLRFRAGHNVPKTYYAVTGESINLGGTSWLGGLLFEF